MSVFVDYQEVYADHGIATFPVSALEKRPLVRGYSAIGLNASRKLRLAGKDGDGLACVAGFRSGLTVLDVDAHGAEGQRLLENAMFMYGAAKMVVRTPSGGFHAYYRHSGESRLIRPVSSISIDILGKGLVLLPPSSGKRTRYDIIEGTYDDLKNLTPMRTHRPFHSRSDARRDLSTMRAGDGRNNQLFHALCTEAKGLPLDVDAYITCAREINMKFSEPLPDKEMMAVAHSVFGYAERGDVRAGNHGAWFVKAEVRTLMEDPYLLTLVAFLKAENSLSAKFWVADGLARLLRWPRRRLAKARRAAINNGWIVMIRGRSKGQPALYEWGPEARKRRAGGKGVS